MQDFNEALRDAKKNWFIASMLEVKGLEGLNQKQFAKRIGVSDSFITRLKGGKAPVPQNVIDKICTEFDILPPEIKLNESSMATEPNEEYKLPAHLTELVNSLKSNLSDLRREVSETYDHIADLKEFNEFLKQQKLANE